MKEGKVAADSPAQATAITQAETPAASSPSEAATNNSSPTAPNNAASTPADLDKKPFRCNICKVAYNRKFALFYAQRVCIANHLVSRTVGSTLDIHIRSVLHQTRASKLHDLAVTGQIDLSQPLIERPEETSPNTKSDAKPGTPSPCSTPKTTGDSLTEQLVQQQLQQAAALNINQQLLLLGAANNAGAGTFPCQRCGSTFPTQELCIQHSQLCALFGPTSANALLKSAQQQAASKDNDQFMRQTKYYSAPVCRSKPPVYKHLREYTVTKLPLYEL